MVSGAEHGSPTYTAPAVSLVIPCFNEEGNVRQLLERIRRLVADVNDLEVIVVENGSTDQTRRRLVDGIAGIERAKLVLVDRNKGYGFGIKRGIEASRGRVVGWTHSDLQTDLEDVTRAISLWQPSSLQIIKGRRVGRPKTEEFFSIGMSIFCSLLFRMPLREIYAQPTLVSGNMVSELLKGPDGFEIDLFALVVATRSSYEEVRFDVQFGPRIHGKSSWNTSVLGRLRFAIRTARNCIDLKTKL